MYEGFNADIEIMMNPDTHDNLSLDNSTERLANLFKDRNDDDTRNFLVRTFEDKGMSHEDTLELVDWCIWTYRFSPYSNN